MSFEELIKTENNEEDSHVDALIEYSEHIEKICNRVINIGKIVFIGFPVMLILIQNLADLDKTSVLLTWIIGMFVLALVLILVGYFDHSLRERLKNVYGDDFEHSSKVKMLQGRALVKTIIKEYSKDRNLRSVDDFAEEFSKLAIENDETLLDRFLGEIYSADDENIDETNLLADDYSGQQSSMNPIAVTEVVEENENDSIIGQDFIVTDGMTAPVSEELILKKNSETNSVKCKNSLTEETDEPIFVFEYEENSNDSTADTLTEANRVISEYKNIVLAEESMNQSLSTGEEKQLVFDLSSDDDSKPLDNTEAEINNILKEFYGEEE